MATRNDDLVRLEQRLDRDIAKLKESLRYWQTWEYEYEGLNEELEMLEEDLKPDEVLEVAKDMALEQVNVEGVSCRN